MSELRELYQETIIDHGRHPRNFGVFPEANHHKEGFNPLCGDKITLHVYEKDGVVEKMMFEGSGCAISMASASLMTETLTGKSKQEIHEIFTVFHQLMMNGDHTNIEKLDKLAVLGGVFEYPARVKCATLAWHTLNAALENNSGTVSTEDTL
jgi:nitrogen fixation NifU-like protein